MTRPLEGDGRLAATHTSRAAAAERTFTALTAWLRKHPDCSYTTRFNPPAKPPFQLYISTPARMHTFCGSDLQDAYAQAAQTILFEEL